MESESKPRVNRAWLWIVVAGGLVLLLIIAITETKARRDAVRQRAIEQPTLATNKTSRLQDRSSFRTVAAAASGAARTPHEIISNKVSQFGRQRCEITYAIAAKYNITVPPEVQEFYEAAEANDWERANALFNAIWKKKNSDEPGAEELRKLSAAMLETYGAMEQAHLWPPEKLLEYGNAILDSLKPGMIYVGGTDSGRFIPTLLNDTAEADQRHVIITQNGLADATYLDYFSFLQGEQVAALNHEDSEKAFSTYIADAQKRFEHDRDFPDEPKQVRPGEHLKMTDGKFEVGGVNSVMQINEYLLRAFIEKNPGLTFAMEESYPLTSFYSSTRPLGPIFEINAAEGEQAFNADAAKSTLNYWQNTTGQITSGPAASKSDSTLKTYSHMVKAQAMFFKERGFPGEAEQAYELARQLWPGNIEAAAGLSDLYAGQGRTDASEQILADFQQRFPEQRPQVDNWRVHHSLFPPPDPEESSVFRASAQSK